MEDLVGDTAVLVFVTTSLSDVLALQVSNSGTSKYYGYAREVTDGFDQRSLGQSRRLEIEGTRAIFVSCALRITAASC